MRTFYDREHERELAKHDDQPTDKRFAVAALVGECEAIAASGALTAPAEQSLRLLIANTLTAFNMPSKAELEYVRQRLEGVSHA